LDPSQYQRCRVTYQETEREILEMHFEAYRIWGATAAILHHLACEIQSLED
jgi:hypothetical protein